MNFDGELVNLFARFVPRDDEGAPGLRSLAAIVEQLASCDYRCEAGPLVNNSAFLELRAGAQDEGCLAQSVPCGGCAWCRMFGGENEIPS